MLLQLLHELVGNLTNVAPDLVIFSWVFLYLLIVEEFQTTMIALTVPKLPEAHLPEAHLPEAHLQRHTFQPAGRLSEPP